MLSFALLIPAAGIIQAAGLNEVSLAVALLLLLLALVSFYDAVRRIAVITRQGIGIAGTFGIGTIWLAWQEILRIQVTDSVVSLTTRGRAIYQLQLDPRTARLVGRMVERQIVGRARE